MEVRHLHGIEGARSAEGVTIVVDTFRAFSTAAYAQASGVGAHYLTDTLDQARALARHHRGALLCGESEGVKPPDFDIGNSPAEVLANDLEGRVLIQRTSAGTRGVLAALGSASVVYPASLVVASATAASAAGSDLVSIVACGMGGTIPTVEDDATGQLIADLMHGDGEVNRASLATATRDLVARSDSAQRLRSASWAHPDDVALCTDVDRFDFAMVATHHGPGTAALTTLLTDFRQQMTHTKS